MSTHRIGDVIDTRDCKNCGRPIQLTYWGNGGTNWTHVHDDGWSCHKSTVAEPA